MPDSQSELLRQILKKYIAREKSQLSSSSFSDNTFEFPIIIGKPKENTDPSKNLLFIQICTGNIYRLFANEYMILLSLQYNSGLENFGFLQNKGNSPIKVWLMTYKSWNDERQRIYDEGAKRAINNYKFKTN